MRITRELLMGWRACYTDGRIAEIVPKAGLTPLEVCDFSGVSTQDRMWVLLREEVLSTKVLRLLACNWARQALALDPMVDSRAVDTIEVAERYAYGRATEDEFAEARDAAYRVLPPGEVAAHSHAWIAVWLDAEDAARCAAKAIRAASVADAAIWDDVWNTIWEDVWTAQLADVRTMLVQEMEP